MIINRLSKDELGNLIFTYEKTGDYTKDYNAENLLSQVKFTYNDKSHHWIFVKTSDPINIRNAIKWVLEYFKSTNTDVEIDNFCREEIEQEQKSVDRFSLALQMGLEIKENGAEPILPELFKRKLMPYQKKSVQHIITLGNAANFSVPGSGKTTIAYAAISSWLNDGIIKKIMVVGPTASFGPWEDEFTQCFGRPPTKLRLSRDNVKDLESIGKDFELFICGFQFMANYTYEIHRFLKKYKVVLIIDESHNIKNPKGKKWATAALDISPFAAKRMVLSGTPMPNDYKDLWTQITFLWPFNEPLGKQGVYNSYVDRQSLGKYRQILNPLFCRIMKKDLELRLPEWKEVVVPLGKYQQKIYDIIAAKTLQELRDYHEQATIQQFRMAKMIRLMQSASNPSLLFELAHEFEVGYPIEIEPLSAEGLGIVNLIKNYSTLKEIPSKLAKAAQLTEEILDSKNKVILWTSFLNNIDVLENQLLKNRKPIVIDGRVSRDEDVENNREERIKEFKNDPNPRVLIATPPSLGESVSLHVNEKGEEVCKNAIYIDRNFNAGQYMQSMDRIHRLGMKKDTVVKYWLLMGTDTIDEVINQRLTDKCNTMYEALNDDVSVLDFNVEATRFSPSEFEKDYLAVIEQLLKQKMGTNASKA